MTYEETHCKSCSERLEDADIGPECGMISKMNCNCFKVRIGFTAFLCSLAAGLVILIMK